MNAKFVLTHWTKTKNSKVAKCDFSQSQLFQANWHLKSTGFRYYGCTIELPESKFSLDYVLPCPPGSPKLLQKAQDRNFVLRCNVMSKKPQQLFCGEAQKVITYHRRSFFKGWHLPCEFSWMNIFQGRLGRGWLGMKVSDCSQEPKI